MELPVLQLALVDIALGGHLAAALQRSVDEVPFVNGARRVAIVACTMKLPVQESAFVPRTVLARIAAAAAELALPEIAFVDVAVGIFEAALAME